MQVRPPAAPRISSEPAAALTAELADDEPQPAGPSVKQLLAEVRRLKILTEVADTVTQSLSLDHQLPRLIALIIDALDAERATLFLHDREAGQLFSRVLGGEGVAEIRIPENAGIAGAVFKADTAEIIFDAYQDARFNQEIDKRTGFHTRNILCVPLRNREGQTIGVTQVLNKRSGDFGEDDLSLAAAINRHAASALEQAMLVERLELAQREEIELLSIAEAISTELHIDVLFTRIMAAATQLLNAERSTLFLYDTAADQLWSQVAEGAGQKEIRIPARAGIAGAAFASGEVLVIPDAYADPRFNRAVDKASGFRTRNILAVPINDKAGEHLGVVQILNKRGGAFAPIDIRRAKAFCGQIAIAIQNAQLFSDVLSLKNYNDSILKSLSNGVVTLDQNLNIVKINEAAERILGVTLDDVLNRPAVQVFGNRNAWVTRSLDYVKSMGTSDYHADTDFEMPDGGSAAINMTAAPLFESEGKPIGCMLVLEDITREKRVRNTMARYVAKEVVDKLLASGEDFLHGNSHVATVLFSDIRRFTTLAEAMSPQETVTMLNEYFTSMVEVVFNHGGMLDKYIGDAIMAVFGTAMADISDADNALLVANEMIRELGRFNQTRKEAGLIPIEIGVGVATGEVLAGSLGSRRRLEYTVIGDNVNLAARLEGANKHYGTTVLVAASTVEALRSHPILRRLDLIQVKGKSQPTLAYEALDHYEADKFPKLGALITAYEAGFDCYQRRDWGNAIQHFGEALEVAPIDQPSQIFIDRCRYYSENAPPENWNGVWIMEDK
ncbi:MAG TPA: GAF domain-containing protein [Stellaceae bacterium]|nr:GAF domain-containing protein [Stellaceae bacterium]